MVSRIWNFIKYWYFRYLVVTELYMVDIWERAAIHILFATVFFICWIFNYGILLTLVNKAVNIIKTPDMDLKIFTTYS